jgi:4-hydroxy-2-oxoheptanedioate aldolase
MSTTVRSSFLLAVIGLTMTACAEPADDAAAGDMAGAPRMASSSDHMNQMIPLLEQGLPIMGIIHPPYTPGRGETEPPDLAAAAADLVEYDRDDFVMNNYSPRTADQYRAYMEALVAAGGSAGTDPFLAKIPIVHDDPDGATQRMIEQLNDGQVVIAMQEVETVEEIDRTVAAMRFTSQGGVRPEQGFERAAAYWGMSEAEYLERADVWPLNPDGELLLTVIVESEDGAANARAIAGHPAVSVVIVGAGTMGGVFSSVNEEGERVRDQEGFDAAVAQILEACKAFEKSCGYPANNPTEIEELMADGWDFFIMQRRNQDAFDAVEAGRRIGGR